MMIDIRPYYSRMNACKKYLDQLSTPKRQPSEKTKAEYRKDVTSMENRGGTPASLAKTKNTYFKYRAAWAFRHVELAYRVHKQASKETDYESKIALIEMLEELIVRIKLFPPDHEREGFKSFGQNKGNEQYETEWEQIKKNLPAQLSRSKKNQNLPKNWSEKYFNHIVLKKSKYADAIAFLAISGCRPSELEGGVSLHLKENGAIKLSIEGKKTHEGQYGQLVREFDIKADTVEFNYLVERLRNNNNELKIQIETAKQLGEQMRKFSKKVFPKLKNYISPYSYRHSFAKKIKGILSGRGDIAVVMGHCNDKSQRFYSTTSKGAGGMSISEIEGDREVKMSADSAYLNKGQSPDDGMRM